MRLDVIDEIAIRKLIEHWQTATKEGKLAEVLALMTDDIVFLTPGQKPMNKEAFIRGFEGLKKFDMDSSSSLKEILISGDLAYGWSELSVTMTPKDGGKPIKRSGPIMSVFRKVNGRWLLFRDANMLSLESDA